MTTQSQGRIFSPPIARLLFLLMLLPIASVGATEWTNWSATSTAEVRRNDTPILLLISAGYCTTCQEIVSAGVDSERFVPLVLDLNVRPQLSSAYLAFAEAFVGEPVELPVAVALTPFLDPVAAKGGLTAESLGTFTDELESDWSRERFLETALMIRRLNLQGWAPTVASTPGQRLSEIYRRLLEGRLSDADSAALLRMSRTALYDQLGGGFHRAARDDAWTTPEFEKVLADQALAVLSYTDAWQITGEPRFASVATATADLLLRQFLDPETGLFFDSLGSHSPGARGGLVDGAHYVWRVSEIREILGDETANKLMNYYGASPEGTFPKQLAGSDLDGAILFNLPEDAGAPSEELSAAAARLLEARSLRPLPERDSTVVTGSTALAISALARAGIVLGESRYSDAAETAVEALLSRNLDGDHLYAVRMANLSVPASQLDYAFLIRSLIDLYEASFKPAYLVKAFELQSLASVQPQNELIPEMIREMAPDPELELIAGLNLVQLGAASADESWIDSGRELSGGEADRYGLLILATDQESRVAPILELVRQEFRPHVMTVLVETTAERDAMSAHVKGLKTVPECNAGKLGERVEWNGKIDCTPVMLLCRGTECSALPPDPSQLGGRLE